MQLNTESDDETLTHNFGFAHNRDKPRSDFAKLSLGPNNTGKSLYSNWLKKAITPDPISKITLGEKLRNIRLLKTADKRNNLLNVIQPRLNVLGNRNFANSKQKVNTLKKVKLSLKSYSTTDLTNQSKIKKNSKIVNNNHNNSKHKKENKLKKLSLSNYPCGDKKINGADNRLSPKLTKPEKVDSSNNYESKRKFDEDSILTAKNNKENQQTESYTDKKLKLKENTENMSVYDYHRPQQQMDTGSNMVGITGNGGLSGGFNINTTKPYIHLTAEEDELNHQGSNLQYYHSSQLAMSTLCNIGNTCYLNSVIYTLRFAPLFLHNLHHLIEDLNQINQKLGQNRIKSSSLGRNVAGLAGQNARSFSSKDLASLGNNIGCDTPKSNRQIATEKLHELFQNLHRNEISENTEPFHADTFLHAIQAVSAIFEGNHQQDAHEFLMCVLDSIRETCQSLTKIISDSPDIIVNGYVSVPEQSEVTSTSPAPLKTSFFSRKSKKKEEKSKFLKLPDSPLKENNQHTNDTMELDGDENGSLTTTVAPTTGDNEKIIEKIKKLGLDFFTEDFVGVTVSTTKCLTCETITEQKETMIDIAVPIYENIEKMDNPHLFFQNSCITKESFRGENKYRCEECFGYTEAIRSISFETLPRLLVIQLKRFSGGMEKINSYIPTPLQIDCFCVKCLNSVENKKRHVYRLYSIITHVGATMSVGHYIAYTCSLDFYTEYLNCSKDKKNHLNRSQSSSGKHGESANSNAGEKNSGLIKKIYFLRSKASSSGDVTKNLKNLNLNGVMSKLTNGGINSNADKIATNSSLPVASTTPNPTMCSGLSCCGIHAESILLRNNGHHLVNGGGLLNNDISDKDNALNNYNTEHHYNYHQQPTSATNIRHGEPTWYMCDDDKIKSMSQTEFEELLSPNNKAAITPYLLFYARINTD